MMTCMVEGNTAPRMRPKISIVTPSFNQGRFIERTVLSVLDQQGDFDLEYLILDGGSTDETLDVLRRYETRLTWTSEHDDGQVDAINKGLTRATGDILAWINSDDTYQPGAFAKVVDAFQRQSEALWLHSKSEIVDAQDRPMRRWISHYKHRRCLHYSFNRLLTEDFIHQPGTFWRRSALQQVGLLDPASQLAFDYDWFLRLAKWSPPVYVPETLACVRWYPSSKSGAQYRRQLQDACTIARKHDPGSRWRDLVRRYRLWRIACAYRVIALFSRTAPAAESGTQPGGTHAPVTVSSTQPLVSIVMPSFQKGPYLRAALESLLGQTYPHLEVIVQDNESHDETQQILKAYAPRLTHLAIEKDAGQSDALRRGYARAQGEILGWLNADDLLMPDAIASAVGVFQQEPQTDLVYGHCALLNDDGTFDGYYHDIQPVSAELLGNSGSFICQPGAFFRRSIYDRLGGLNADLHYTMDWDLWCRIARSGGALRMVDQVWAAARIYADTKSLGGGWPRFREILRTNRRYKTTWLPRAAMAYLYGAKLRPYGPWLNRPFGALWHLWTGKPVAKTVVEGIAAGRRLVAAHGRIHFPLFRKLRGLEVQVLGPLASARLNGEAGTIETGPGGSTVRWCCPQEPFTKAVALELSLANQVPGGVNVQIGRLHLDLAPDDRLPG